MTKFATNTKPKADLPKAERICSKKIFEHLFAQGQTLRSKGVRLVYSVSETPITPVKRKDLQIFTAFSIPKKTYRRAHDRNRLKRQMREIYRQNKARLRPIVENRPFFLYVMFIYLNKPPLAFVELQNEMLEVLDKLTRKLGVKPTPVPPLAGGEKVRKSPPVPPLSGGETVRLSPLSPPFSGGETNAPSALNVNVSHPDKGGTGGDKP